MKKESDLPLVNNAEYIAQLKERLARCNVVLSDLKKMSELSAEIKGKKPTTRALCINIQAGEIYVGRDHLSMFYEHDIPDTAYLAGEYRFDTAIGKTVVPVLIDARPGHNDQITDEEVKRIVDGKIEEFLILSKNGSS